MNFQNSLRLLGTTLVVVPLSLVTNPVCAKPLANPKPTPAPLPLFRDDSLPTPPQQQAPWTADAALPANFVSATQTLFEQGMADPRGGDYRNVDIVAGSVWGGGGIAHVRGWVLPSDGNGAQRFAVCWNGLVYPVVAIGAPADVKADIAKVVDEDEKQRAEYAKRDSRIPFYRFRNAISEGVSASPTMLLPLQACLLLRLGETELAKRVWTAWTAGMNAGVNDDKEHLRDPYLMLAGDWTWAMFDRAVCAHMRGDDRLSVVDARFLTTVNPSIEAEAKRRGFDKINDYKQLPYLTFLESVPALLADEERRIAEPASPPLAPNATKAQKIAALIADIDEVKARKWGQPGGLDLSQDPIIRALGEMGEDAVEPLIDALEKENRLTRSVNFGRDFHRGREFVGAAYIEYEVLTGILKTEAFAEGQDSYNHRNNPTPGTYRDVAERIRAYWKQYGKMAREERWYVTLKNDKAGSDAWRQAAVNIVTPRNVSIAPTNTGGISMTTTPLKPGEKPQLRGEVLRSKTNPSVAELLALRADEIGKIEEGGSSTINSKGRACEVALYLSTWDAEAAVPALQLATQRYREALTKDRDSSSSQSLMLRLFLARMKGGDAAAWPDYKAWAAQHKPEEHDIFLRNADNLSALWEAPNNKALQSAGEWLLGDKSSPLWSRLNDGYLVSDSFSWTGYLWKAPSFKAYILNQLRDTTVAGTLSYYKSPQGKNEWVTQFNGKSSSFPVQPGTPQPESTTPTPIRVCDYYAWLLWHNTGELNRSDRFKKAPRFELYWSQKKRDATLPKSAEFVRKFQR